MEPRERLRLFLFRADELPPRLMKQGQAFEYWLDGYWRDVGTVESYWAAHMELLSPDPPIRLDDPQWPVHTFPRRGSRRPHRQVAQGASLGAGERLSPGWSA
jgi:glucose-1-phosphate adenylyltransferase